MRLLRRVGNVGAGWSRSSTRLKSCNAASLGPGLSKYNGVSDVTSFHGVTPIR